MKRSAFVYNYLMVAIMLASALACVNCAVSAGDDVETIFRDFQRVIGEQITPPASIRRFPRPVKRDTSVSDNNAGSNNVTDKLDDDRHGIAAVKAPSVIRASSEAGDATRREFSFHDVDLRQALEIVARLTDMNIFLDDAVPARRITTFLQDISIEEALPHLLRTNSLMMKEVSDRTVLIFPRNKERDYMDETDYKTYFLSNVPAREMIQTVKSLDREAWVSVNEELNAMIVKTTADNIAMLDQIVEDIDKRKPQILLDLRLVETTARRLDELGISFDQPLSSIVLPNHPETSDKVFRITTPSALLRALEDDDQSRVLARPKLRLLDGKNARIRIADRLPMKITTHTTDPNAPTFTDRIEWQDAGIKFEAELLSIHRNNIASVKIGVEVSSVIGTTADGYPEIRTREAESTLRAGDGETIVVGGLLNTKYIDKRVRTPVLSRIPLFGDLFVYRKREKVESEIIIFLSPHFVDEAEGEDEIIWARK